MTMTRRMFLGHVAASPLIPVAADLSRRSGEAAKADAGLGWSKYGGAAAPPNQPRSCFDRVRPYVTTEWVSHHCSAAVDETDEKEHQCDHQQHVNERADGISADHSQQPGNQQNHCKRKKHHVLLIQRERDPVKSCLLQQHRACRFFG